MWLLSEPVLQECICCTNVGSLVSQREFLKSVKVLEVHGIGTDTRALVVMSKVCNTLINLTLS